MDRHQLTNRKLAAGAVAGLLVLTLLPPAWRGQDVSTGGPCSTCITVNAEGGQTRQINPRDNLAATDNGANSTYTIDFTPGDANTLVLSDEFSGGNQSNGTIGALGWALQNIVAAPTLSAQASVWPHLGVLRIAAAATSGDGGVISLQNTTGFGDMSTNTNWDSTFIFKLGQTTSTTLRVGFTDAPATDNSANGIWLRYDTNQSDSAFKVETRKASTSTVGATTYTVDTNWHKVRIRSTTAGQVIFTFDANADQTLTSNVPTVVTGAFCQVITRTTSANFADFDFFSIKFRGLGR